MFTDILSQINAQTPVSFQYKETSTLLESEIEDLLERLGVEQEHRKIMQSWFGDVYGRYHILIPPLLKRWSEMRKIRSQATIFNAFYSAATMEDQGSARFVPAFNTNLSMLMKRLWEGKASLEEKGRLVPYGLLKSDGSWSCDYIRRRYFRDIFHCAYPSEELFRDSINTLPCELDLAKKGLEEISWHQLRMSGSSSYPGFAIEDVWQTEFYGAIGEFIPRNLVFCKEFVAETTNQVDFVLRNDTISFSRSKWNILGGRYQAMGQYAYITGDAGQ